MAELSGGCMKKSVARKWYGQIGKHMQEHLSLRTSMGIVGNAETIALHQFNIFLHKEYPEIKTPNRHSILHFLNTKKHLTPWGRRNVIIHVRQFCRFLNQRGISCYVPDKTIMPKLSYKPRYFPLGLGDVECLIREMRLIRPQRPFVGETYSIMVGLLWSTGMRRKEVVNLNHSDINFKERTILIRETKFRKTRMIPIDKSVIVALEKYFLKKKKLKYSTESSSPFFINLSGKRVRGESLQDAFSRVVKRVGLYQKDGKHPVLHDLRHNFVTQTLKRFYSCEAKLPSHTMLNIIATYLGHADMLYSQYYMHPDFDLLEKASRRFENQNKVVGNEK